MMFTAGNNQRLPGKIPENDTTPDGPAPLLRRQVISKPPSISHSHSQSESVRSFDISGGSIFHCRAADIAFTPADTLHYWWGHNKLNTHYIPVHHFNITPWNNFVLLPNPFIIHSCIPPSPSIHQPFAIGKTAERLYEWYQLYASSNPHRLPRSPRYPATPTRSYSRVRASGFAAGSLAFIVILCFGITHAPNRSKAANHSI